MLAVPPAHSLKKRLSNRALKALSWVGFLGGKASPAELAETAPNRMAIAQTLPEEILEQIFANLTSHKASLKYCTLVCQSWLYPSSRLLFADVRLAHDPSGRSRWRQKGIEQMLHMFSESLKSGPRLTANLRLLTLQGAVNVPAIRLVLAELTHKLHTLTLRKAWLTHSNDGTLPPFSMKLGRLELDSCPTLADNNCLHPLDVISWFNEIAVLRISGGGDSDLKTVLNPEHNPHRTRVHTLNLDFPFPDVYGHCLYPLRNLIQWKSIKTLRILSTFVNTIVKLINAFVHEMDLQSLELGINMSIPCLFPPLNIIGDVVTPISAASLEARSRFPPCVSLPSLRELKLSFNVPLALDVRPTGTTDFCEAWLYCLRNIRAPLTTLTLDLKFAITAPEPIADGFYEECFEDLIRSLNWGPLNKLATGQDGDPTTIRISWTWDGRNYFSTLNSRRTELILSMFTPEARGRVILLEDPSRIVDYNTTGCYDFGTGLFQLTGCT